MDVEDFGLERFAKEGAPALPEGGVEGYVEHEGARLWYAAYGVGAPVMLLHGGLGHAGNWGYQVEALVAKGYRAVVMDNRGHGRSTRDERPFVYERMAGDALAVLDALGIAKAAFVGWSDGAVIALMVGEKAPERCAGVFYFACNMDPSGVRKEFAPSEVLDRCMTRHVRDYARLSGTPEKFKRFAEDLRLMQTTQPDYSAEDLGKISVPVTISQGDLDEFIYLGHSEYLARSIPGGRLVVLEGVSHFAPLQRPGFFDEAVFGFLNGLGWR